MNKLILLPIAGAVGWIAVTAAVMNQTPVVEVRAAEACAAAADTWVADLSKWGYDVVRFDAPAGAGCLEGRAAGFELHGAVPAKDIAYLLRKKPRSVSGLTVEGDGVPEGQVMAITIDGLAAFPPPPKRKS